MNDKLGLHFDLDVTKVMLDNFYKSFNEMKGVSAAFRELPESLKPIYLEQLKSVLYSPEMIVQLIPKCNVTIPDFAVLMSKILESIKLDKIENNEIVPEETSELANKIVENLSLSNTDENCAQLSLPIEKKSNWSKQDIMSLIALFLAVINIIINVAQNNKSIESCNINIENINITSMGSLDEIENYFRNNSDDYNQSNK